MHHVLVTNDFPPKLGGIQTYLWELWRRLPPDSFTVIAPDQPGADGWDRTQPFDVVRMRGPLLVPGRTLARAINAVVARHHSGLVLLDPVAHTAPLVGRLDVPYGVVVHGAEVVIPASMPVVQLAVRRSLRNAAVVVAAGDYPARAAELAAGRPVPTVNIPPGVDVERFVPVGPARRAEIRQRYGVDPDAPLIVSVSRLVPRKGMDTLIAAAARLAVRHPGVEVLIAGQGRDRSRLAGLIDSVGAPVRLVDRVDGADLPDFYAMADVFAMLCRNRWGGLEQEGFGIVFLEAAACGVPQVAGNSGGAGDAVVDGTTGVLVDHPRDLDDVVDALDGLLADPQRRAAMGLAARDRAVNALNHDVLAARLHDAIVAAGSVATVTR
jgi:phosphatidylinositol alpha-1,6-mannosyltransferase